MKAGITKGLPKMKIATLARFALAFALMLLFGNLGFADELPIGAAGTLKKEVFTSEAMPAIAPPYPTDVPYVYRNLDMVLIAFTTDEQTAASVVPEGFNLLKIPQLPGQASVMAIFAKYRGNDQIGPYMETIISVPVVFNGHLYLYVPFIYVDTDAALLAGREFGGYPKKIADITLQNYGAEYKGAMSRSTMHEKTPSSKFSDIMSMTAKRGGKLFSVPLPATKMPELPFPYNQILILPPANGRPQDFILETTGLRRFPGVGAGPKGVVSAQVLEVVDTPWVVSKADLYVGKDSSLDFYPSKEDPIAQYFPIHTILATIIMQAEVMTVDAKNWKVVKDYLH
jgi:hypothetical protein